MTEFTTLSNMMSGLRLASMMLALSILFQWGPSLWRVLRDRTKGRDAVRAIWVPMAFSILLFQARWLYPGLADLSRMRLWVVAHAAMVLTLVAAIYYHGAGHERFNLRRTMMAHIALTLLCIGFAAMVR